jgi:hypothetical protein
MNNPKFYRLPWTKEKTEFLIQFWPHFGTPGIKKLFPELTGQQIKSKVNHLRLHLLPKKERLCFVCRTNYQVKRGYGLRCKDCYLSKRKDCRRCTEYGLEEWIKETVRTCKYRDSESDITFDYLMNLLVIQHNKCFYSKRDLIFPRFKQKRMMCSASLDKKDPKLGYKRGNVVWCCWGCNAGKNEWTYEEYVALCQDVIKEFHGN